MPHDADRDINNQACLKISVPEEHGNISVAATPGKADPAPAFPDFQGYFSYLGRLTPNTRRRRELKKPAPFLRGRV